MGCNPDTLYKATSTPDVVTTFYHYWGPCTNPTEGSANIPNALVQRSSSWKRGECIPNFHARKARGELLPHTNFEKVEYETTYTTGEIRGHWTRYPCDTEDSSNGVPLFGLQGESALREEVRSACSENYEPFVQAAAAKIDSYGFDALTAIAELTDLRRTWELLSTKALRARRTLGDKFETAWLGGRYGLRPLYADFINFNEAVEKKLGKLSRYSERVGASSNWENLDFEGNVSIGWGRPASVYSRIRTKVDLSLRGSVTADIKLETFDFNPLQTGWEIVPYSFVVDWFLGVGQAISAASFLTTAKAYQASGGWKVTILRESETLGFPVTNVGAQYVVDDFTTCKRVENVIWEKRIPTSVSILPFTRFNLDVWKGVDLFYLIRQLTKSK